MGELDSVVIDVDGVIGVEKKAYLVGRLVREKYSDLSVVMQLIFEAWKPNHGMSSREVGSGLVLFCFNDSIDRDWVLKHQPWLFEDSLFAIEKLNEQRLWSLDNVTVECCSFWVRLYDVPISCMNERCLRIFAKQIGILKSVDKSSEKFMRFKVSIKITEPLPRGITVRVKGEHLWLPLKYESLPLLYCFCCGTIGHTHNGCGQKSSGNLEYSSCIVEQQATTLPYLRSCSAATLPHLPRATTLPHLPRDIVENILSRVAVKYLFRFKAVSRQWKATICDPTFAEIHLQRYKKSSPNLIAWKDTSPTILPSEEVSYYNGLHIAEVRWTAPGIPEHYGYQFVSMISHPQEGRIAGHIACSLDGLYLIIMDDRKSGTIWNPSCRAYRKLCFPQFIHAHSYLVVYEMYYNPLMKDYKVLIADIKWKHYMVYSCRHDTWGEWREVKEKEMNDLFGGGSVYWNLGISFNGCPHWVSITGVERVNKVEIIYFDWEVETFNRLGTPYYYRLDPSRESGPKIILASLGGHLCLLIYSTSHVDSGGGDMRIVKRIENDDEVCWMESNTMLPHALCHSRPLFNLSENEIIFEEQYGFGYQIFDGAKKTVGWLGHDRRGKRAKAVPYLENLFLLNGVPHH